MYPEGLALVDKSATFARYWNDTDYAAYCRKKSLKCAEVLVPDDVPPTFILGAYVSGNDGRVALEAVAHSVIPTVNTGLFFV